MLFMVVEHYTTGPAAVYERATIHGRMLPDGLDYIDSWVVDDESMDRCFQLMECDDARLLQDWLLNWSDLMECEIVPVVPSNETRELVQSRL